MPNPAPAVDLPWHQPGWLDEAAFWIEAELGRAGRPPIGPLEIVHRRPWSAFGRIPTARGTVYFKAPAPAVRFEAALTQALGRWQPALTIPLLAVDLRRGWMLSADAGPTLRTQLHATADLQRFHPLLRRYAELQKALAARVPDMLSLGVPDRRLERLPSLYDELLLDEAALRLGLDPGLSLEQHRHLIDLRPRFTEACLALAAVHLPATLTHEEIHSGNVVVGEAGELLTDWSDASLAHPFLTMLVTLRSAAFWLHVPESHPEVQRLRAVYLEAWAEYASPVELQTAFDLAYRVAMVNRSLSYRSILGPLPDTYRLENDAIHGWLVDYREAEERLSV
jgi:hypothetical protein